jgi:cytochrome c oxidase subunit IV
MPKPPANVVVPWAALIGLLMATLGLAYLPLGAGNLVVALAIATAKGLIVAAVFMKLAGPPSLRWVFAGAGLFWVAFLFGLSMTDYATRTGWPFAG